MSRRTERMAEAAAAASEAGRVLQQRQQEARVDPVETPQPEAQTPEPESRRNDDPPRRIEPRNDPRTRAMEAVLASREQQMNAPAQEDETETPPASETPSASGAAPQQAAGAIETPAPAPVVETVKVKVDGEEFDVPKAEVEEFGGVKAYQIMKAADNRLRKANELIAQNRQMGELLTRQALQTLQPPREPQVNPAQAALQKLAAARFGTDEEYADAMQEYNAAVAPRGMDSNLIVTQATLSIKHDAALAKFKADFPDLVMNPMLGELVTLQVNKRLAPFMTPAGPDWQKLSSVDFQEVYSTIGNQVRSVAAPRPPQAQPHASPTTGTPSQVPSEREARKASIVNLPTAAARAETPTEKELTPEEARKEAILSMKKARGIPVG